MRQPLPVLLHGFRFAAVFAGALCFVLTGLSGASRAQDNPQRVFQQFFEIMREIQREAQRKKANREGDDSRQTSGTPAAGVRYKVAGMELGQNVDLAEARSRGFTCGPSDTYPLHSRCSMTERNREGRGEYSATSSFLVSPEGRALYVNQSIAPAFWTASQRRLRVRQKTILPLSAANIASNRALNSCPRAKVFLLERSRFGET
jgi:hypothetical protein